MLYGRDAEVGEIARLIDRVRTGRGGALVLLGAPGIGKSALLAQTRDGASDLQVLAARGIEAEIDLPFAAVHQLLRPVWNRVEEVSGSDVAILREAFGAEIGSNQQRFLVYSACLNILSDLAARSGVVCLIDDAQWLDSSSAEALQFCARRLDHEPVVMLFAAREGDLERFDPTDLPTSTVGPLGPEVAAALLGRTADIDDAVSGRILDQARGNPLALIELPRALDDDQLAGVAPLPDELPLTDQLEASYSRRVLRLPDDTRRALLVAATDDSEDVRVVVRAMASMDLAASSLDAAERAGLVRVRGNQLEFVHPLVRSALKNAATDGDRRTAHRTIADALAGDDEQADRRAWHLASATVVPDAAIVDELDAAAVRALRRGGFGAAARALDRAAALTTDPAERAERLVRAAHAWSMAGRDEMATALADRIDPGELAPSSRAVLAFVRASTVIRWHGRPAAAIADLVDTARSLAPVEPGLAIRLLPVAMFAGWQAWDGDAQREAARVASSIPVGGLDATERHLAESIAGFAALLDGDHDAAETALRSTIDWGASIDDAQQVIWTAWAALWLGDDAEFAALLRRAVDLARRSGEIGALVEALGMQSVQQALLAQRYDESAVSAHEALRLARDLGAASLTLLPKAALAICAAVRGDPDARRLADEVVSQDLASTQPFRASPARYALALIDMAAGQWERALEHLDAIADPNDPAYAIAAPEMVEAAARSGAGARAASALELFERRTSVNATGARVEACRALLASPTEADRHFDAAAALLATARPFDRPRVQLLHGEHLRRDGRRAAARERLRAAIDGFDAIGAEAWSERARRELQATGETARRRTPDARTQLTPQELQIAHLVASGLTNKEVAQQLYLSPRTIDAHLRGVFAKLGISSRKELPELGFG